MHVTYKWHATGSQFCVAACSVHARGRGVGTNECIIHMRQDAFLPVKGVGLTPHVPGLKGAPLPEMRHDSLHLGVSPVYGMSCVHCMFCHGRSIGVGIGQN